MYLGLLSAYQVLLKTNDFLRLKAISIYFTKMNKQTDFKRLFYFEEFIISWKLFILFVNNNICQYPADHLTSMVTLQKYPKVFRIISHYKESFSAVKIVTQAWNCIKIGDLINLSGFPVMLSCGMCIYMEEKNHLPPENRILTNRE